MLLRRLSLLFSTVLILGSCTLQTLPPTVSVQVKLSGDSRGSSGSRGARVGPALDQMKCFAVIVKGAPGAVSDSQVANRSATCLGMNGAFNGPYTYDQLNSGVSLSLSAAEYTFSIVGYDGVASCGEGPSSLYNTTTAAENYAVGAPVVANLASASNLSIDGRIYNASTATNRTPSCPVQSLDCSFSTVCDTFTAANGTTLDTHNSDVGGLWTRFGLGPSAIYGNQLEVTTVSNTGTPAFMTQDGSSRTVVTVRGNAGGSDVTSTYGIVLRYVDSLNYAHGVYFRSSGTLACGIRIIEAVSGSFTTLDEKLFSFPAGCPSAQDLSFSFSVDGFYYAFNMGTDSLSGAASPALVGTKVGLIFTRAGTQNFPPKVDFFKAVAIP